MAVRKRKIEIPIHQIGLSNLHGLEIEYLRGGNVAYTDPMIQQAHRDNYYIFFLLTKGTINFMVDFDKVQLKGNMLGFIRPGQVHKYEHHKIAAEGWFLAVDTVLIDARYRAVFEDKMLKHQSVKLKDITDKEQCLFLIKQMVNKSEGGDTISIIHNLVNAFIGMTASHFSQIKNSNRKHPGRAALITAKFRKLVAELFTTRKRPADYAMILNISTTYLNEVLHQQTGTSSTFWIQQETMLEAKRLLYHTDLTVKEIAHKTGFADHAYFSRLFRKIVHQTPLSFRAKYRELSNHTL